MKTLNLSNANVNNSLIRSSSSSSLRASSSNVETLKKMKKYESDDDVAEEVVSAASVVDEHPLEEAHKKEDLLSADEEECAPGATKSKDTKPAQQEANDTQKAPKKNDVEPKKKTEEVATTKVEKKNAESSPVRKNEGDDERECYRRAIVDVPALVELLSLIGRCPVCKSSLRTDKISTDEATSAVNVSLRCARLRCQFTKHWCSSPTAGIFSSSTDSATK